MTPSYDPAAASAAPATGVPAPVSTDPAMPATPAPAAPAAPPVPPAAPAVPVTPISPVPTALAHDDPKPASSKQKVGDVVSFEDYDYVTETTTIRHALIVAADQTTTVTRDGKDEEVPALAVVFLGESVTLPADAFTV